MSNFRLIRANDESQVEILASMHHLRWEVFSKELKWTVGLQTFNCMEHDIYDKDGSVYIVRVNDQLTVDACCRLMPTSRPYMLGEHYAHFIMYESIPNSDRIWEISRTCASQDARCGAISITAQLIAASIEFGLANKIDSFVSLTSTHVYPMLKRIVGWDSCRLGKAMMTNVEDNDESYALKHPVTYEAMKIIRNKNHFSEPFLFDVDRDMQNVKEIGCTNLESIKAGSVITGKRQTKTKERKRL